MGSWIFTPGHSNNRQRTGSYEKSTTPTARNLGIKIHKTPADHPLMGMFFN